MRRAGGGKREGSVKRSTGVTRGPGGLLVPLSRAADPDQVGRSIRPGVIVETDFASAEACGAWVDDCLEAEEAFEAAEDPAGFGGGTGGRHGSLG